MEYNFLLLEDNKLSIKKNKTFLQLTQENIDNLKADYSLISTNKIKGSNPPYSKVIELLKDNEVVINFEKVSSALKEVENNKIITHLSRENFRKISVIKDQCISQISGLGKHVYTEGIKTLVNHL